LSRERRSDCPIHFGLQAFGDAWTLLILRDLLLKDRSTYCRASQVCEQGSTHRHGRGWGDFAFGTHGFPLPQLALRDGPLVHLVGSISQT
jgi:hypothetical protein